MIDINYFKTKLEEEKKKLEENLTKIAHPDANDPDDWKTDPERLNVMVSDKNELADIFEESTNKEAIEKELEDRLNEVKSALERIKQNTYGKCEQGCQIEEKRLEANPAATTCIEHSQSV